MLGFADRIFAKLKPEWAGVKLDPNNKLHKEPIQEYKRVARDVAARFFPAVANSSFCSHKDRGDLPRDFLLGWMAVESDGQELCFDHVVGPARILSSPPGRGRAVPGAEERQRV